MVHADPVLCRRTISNLLSNALHYTPRGGTVTLSVTPAEDYTTMVKVRDMGVGIAPEHLPKIFDRFYRIDPARSQATLGWDWDWRRFQPTSALSQWYEQRFGHGNARLRQIGIVALARKLLIALWRFFKTGVLPEAAVLKAETLGQ